MGTEWLLDWPQAAEAGAAVCGGKGWNLGRLHRYGFAVPAGGVLVAEAYTRLLAAPSLQAFRAAVAGVSADQAADPEVASKLATLRAALEATALPEPVAGAVRAFLVDSGLANVPVAVRSSATAEDSAAASFAGIHRSFLNVVGVEAVLQAIKGCYASLWTPAALAYRRRLHLTDEEVACAVVICAMVAGPGEGPPRAAGVAFSCDPRTGRRDQVTISAVPGLGEALVSGQVNPEEITVTLRRGHLHLTDRKGPPGPALTETQVLELARLVWRVHWALGDGQDPQDVEWAHDGQRFWLLQARPVTRLPRATFPAIRQMPVIWSNANVKEVVPGVQSTLSWSLIQGILPHLLFAPQEAVHYPLPKGIELTRRFAGRAYFNLTLMQWAFYDPFGLTPAQFNRSLGGYQPEIAVPAGNPYRGLQGWKRRLAGLRLARLLLGLARQFPQEVAQTFALAREGKAVDLARQTKAALLNLLFHLSDLAAALGPRFQLANAAAAAWQPPLLGLLSWRMPSRAQALTAALMAGSGEVTSAEHGYRLFDLVHAARCDPAAHAYLHQTPLDPHGWRQLAEDSPFRREMKRFLAEFGHRAVYEVEIANPRWNEDPLYLLEQVRLLLATDQTQPPQDRARLRRREAEAEVSSHLRWLRPVVFWLAARARQGAALREAGKSAMVAVHEPLRYLTREAGRRLVAAGALDELDDVFHLTVFDVETYLRGEWDGSGARALVTDRKAQCTAWLAAEPADVFVEDADGRPRAWQGESVKPRVEAETSFPPGTATRQPSSSYTLTGVGVASGRASGRACLIRHPSEGKRLENGQILVAPTTDPGWTPLFLRAAAVVMEVGGYLSHGAIVAREYGIPAVVNIPGLLNAVEAGQLLTVDGDAGQVLLNKLGRDEQGEA